MASYCYYDSTGNLLEFITQAPQRNGDDGDKVYVHIEGLTPTVLQMYWKNSAGTTGNTNITSTLTTAQVPYDQYRDLEYFQYYTDYTFYVFTAPTSVAGLFTMTPYADTKAFDPYNVTVQDNTIALDSSMTSSNYAYLLSQVKQGVVEIDAGAGMSASRSVDTVTVGLDSDLAANLTTGAVTAVNVTSTTAGVRFPVTYTDMISGDASVKYCDIPVASPTSAGIITAWQYGYMSHEYHTGTPTVNYAATDATVTQGTEIPSNGGTSAVSWTIRAATSSTAGIMTATEYKSLSSYNYALSGMSTTYTTTDASLVVPYIVPTTGVTANQNVMINGATTTTAGLMSAADKSFIRDIPNRYQAKIGTPVNKVAIASNYFTKKALAGDLYEYSYALPTPLATTAFGFPAVWAVRGGEYVATGQGYYTTGLLVLTFPVDFTLSPSIMFLFDYWYNS